MARTKHPLHCFCSRHPLLAMYGIDDRSKPYVHVRVFKQRRIFAELIAHGGDVSICCRECFRWHRIIFRTQRAELREIAVPDEVKGQ